MSGFQNSADERNPATMPARAPLIDPPRRRSTDAMRVTPARMRDPLVPTIFHEPWWLDIASGGDWQQVEVRRKDRLVGRLPYTTWRGAMGLRMCGAPPLAHVLGPAVDEGQGSLNTRMLDRIDIMKELAQKLPRTAYFSQVCHRGIVDLMGFQGSGYDTAVHFTLEIDPAAEAVLWAGMRDKTRNVIRRFQQQGRVEEITDPERFRHFYRHNLGDAASYFDLGAIAPLYQACRQRDQGRMLMACDLQQRPAAALFYVWDADRLCYFLSTRDRTVADNGAASNLLWQAMLEASRRGLQFDFDGVASEGSARFYAGFGGRVAPRYSIRRAQPVHAVLQSSLSLMRGSRRNHFTQP